MKRLAARQFIDQACVLYVSHLHILSLCCYCYYFAFLVPKIFWRKHIFGPDVFLIFVVVFFCLVIYIYVFYVLDWSCIFQYSVETAPWEIEAASKRAFKRLQQTKQPCSIKVSPHTNLLAFFKKLIHQHAADAEGVCCRQGKSEQMESWGICRKTERICWIAFASSSKLQAK